MTTANRFEDRLLDQLQEIVAAHPAPTVVTRRRPRRRRLALAGVSVAAATAAAALVATGSDVTPSAYAVQPRADGSVTVRSAAWRTPRASSAACARPACRPSSTTPRPADPVA